MLPPVVQRQVDEASSYADMLEADARVVPAEQPVNRARLEGGAKHIKVLIALLQSATWAAQVNKQTIVEMQQP